MELTVTSEIKFDGTHYTIDIDGHQVGKKYTKVEAQDRLNFLMKDGAFQDILSLYCDLVERMFKEKESK